MRKKSYTKLFFFTFLFIFGLFQYHYAQAPDTLWTKTYGGVSFDYGCTVQQTIDGGYIIVGRSSSFGAGSSDVWLIKIDALGDTLWTKTYGGYQSDYGESVQQTSDGGYIVTGATYSFGVGECSVWLIKTDTLGDTLWTKTFTSENWDFACAVQQTKDDGYIITGWTYYSVTAERDVWLIKTDASGDTLWTKTYGNSNNDEKGFSVQQTTDDGYIIIGYTESFGAGGKDIWLIKTDESGDTLWTKTFGGINHEEGYTIQQTTDDGYILAGYTTSYGSGSADVWLIKINSIGNIIWTKTIGGNNWDEARSVQQTTDGGYILTGWTNSFGSGSHDVWLGKTDASGDTLWTTTFGYYWTYNIGYSVQQTTDEGYIVLGSMDNIGGTDYDIWLIKTNSDPSKIEPNIQSCILKEYILHQNYPNPFNPSTIINFTLPKSEKIKIEVLNLLGQKIKTLINKHMSAGSHSVEFMVKNLTSGVYLYRIKAGEFQEVKKMIILR